MLSVILFSTILIMVTSANGIGPINNSLVSEIVVSIIKSYFKTQHMIRVFEAYQVDLLNLISKIDKTFTVYSGAHRKIIQLDDTGEYINNPSKAIGYLMVDPDFEVLELYARINPNGRWLFLLTKSDDEATIQRNLNVAWHEYYMLNTLLVTTSSQFTKVYLFNPFLDDEKSLMKVNINPSNLTQQLDLLNLSAQQRLTNLHQHRLNISILRPNTEFTRPLATADSPYQNFTAIDATNGAFLDYILRSMNATPHEQPNGRYLSNGNIRPNGSLTGILKLIDERIVELSVNNRLVTHLGKSNVAYLRALNRPPLVYILQKRHPVSTDVLFSVFHPNAVGYQVATLVLLTFTWWAVEISATSLKRRSFVRVILDLFSTLFNIGINELHSRLAFRLVFTVVLLYAFIVNNVFQGQVVSKLNSPIYSDDPQTLDQLLALEIPLYSYLRSNEIYPTDNGTMLSPSRLQRIANRNIFNDDFVANAKLIKDMLGRKQDVAILMKIGSAIGVRAGNYDPETNEDIVHIVPESPTSYFTAYTARRDSPFLSLYNELILQAIETGFVIYGDRALELNNYLGHLRRYKQRKPPLEIPKITLQNVRLLFQLWLMLMGVAGVSFCVEIVVNKWFSGHDCHRAKPSNMSHVTMPLQK